MSDITIIKSGVIETDRNGTAFNNVRFIRDTLKDISQKFFHLGFLLDEAKFTSAYATLGYTDLYTYAEAEFDMGRTTVKNLLSVYYMTAEYRRETNCFTSQMKERYKPYSFSQLVEMTAIDDYDKAALITPDMTVRQIKDLKRNAKSLGQTSDQTDTEPRQLAAASPTDPPAQEPETALPAEPPPNGYKWVYARDMKVGDIVLTHGTRKVEERVVKLEKQDGEKIVIHYEDTADGGKSVIHYEWDSYENIQKPRCPPTIEGVPDGVEYLPVSVSALAPGDVFYCTRVGGLLTIDKVEPACGGYMITSHGKQGRQYGPWNGYYTETESVALVESAGDCVYEPVPFEYEAAAEPGKHESGQTSDQSASLPAPVPIEVEPDGGGDDGELSPLELRVAELEEDLRLSHEQHQIYISALYLSVKNDYEKAEEFLAKAKALAAKYEQ